MTAIADEQAERARAAEALPLELVNAPYAFWRGFGRDVSMLWGFRELLLNLVRRELKARYKDSVLGFLWSFLRPLLQLFVYTVALGIFLGSGKAIPDFGIYLFTGLLCWNLFNEILAGSTGSIVGNSGLIKKVYFPREIFPLAVVGAALFNVFVQTFVLFVGYLITGKWPHVQDLAILPLAIFVLIVWATALGLILSAVNVYLRDVQYLVEVGLLLWFWGTPIVYAWSQVYRTVGIDHPTIFRIYLLNPMSNVVFAFQRALWPAGKGTAIMYTGNLWLRLGVLAVVGVVLLWICQRVFARLQGSFAQEL
jgi:ABC-2 type transport system permease protein